MKIIGLNDTTIHKCPGSIDTIRPSVAIAGYTFDTAIWTPSLTYVRDSIDSARGLDTFLTYITTPDTCTKYKLTVTVIDTANLIINGDFGNIASGGVLPTGWRTGYGNSCGTVATTGGVYCLTNSTTTCISCGAFCNVIDHTPPNTGFLMMINGDLTGTTPVLYDSTLLLCCQTKYRFSFWAATWTNFIAGGTGAPPSITIFINGIPTTFPLDATCLGWKKYTVDFTTDSCRSTIDVPFTSIDLTAVSLNNDFVLDDIQLHRLCTKMDSFTLCPYSLGAIMGDSTVCVGSNILLFDTTLGGTYSSTNLHSTSGLYYGYLSITGVSVGTDTITYTSSMGCEVTKIITINPLPTAILGDTAVCLGSTISLSDTTMGGTWTSSAGSGSVTISGGVVTGVTAGTATLTYTLSATGCFISQTIIVDSIPSAIVGPDSLCIGTTISLTDSVTGGTWTSSNTAIAIIDAASGIVTGINAGTVTITYANGPCFVTYPITVNETPVITTQDSMLCDGGTTTLTATPSGGTWTYPATTALTFIGGTVIGNLVTVPTDVLFTYTSLSGCVATIDITVNPCATINGGTEICVNGTTPLTATIPGGTWGSINPAIADVDATGVVTGYSAGTTTITYTVSGYTSSIDITVDPLPDATITDAFGNPLPASVCGTPIDLYVSGCTTPGNTYLWTPTAGLSCSTCCMVTADPSITTTYTVSVTSTQGCMASNTITVIPGDKCICTYSGSGLTAPFVELGATGFVTSSPLPGNYFVARNIIITGAPGTVIHFTNCVIDIRPGFSITVASGVKLIIEGSHLFCCNKMWQGLILSTTTAVGTSGPSGQLELKASAVAGPVGPILTNTMIEDAHIAVDIESPVQMTGYNPNTSTTDALTLYSHGATFNKDNIGVQIVNYQVPMPVALPATQFPCYPFVIENTVFTTRNFFGYFPIGTIPTVATYWPFRWPNTTGTADGLKTVGTWAPLTPYDPPYNIDNPNADGPGLKYPYANCNDGTPANIGINLNGVGLTTGSLGASIYQGCYLGSVHNYVSPNEPNNELNLFDSLYYGIFAINSNVVVRNSNFQHITGDLNVTHGTIAIHSERTYAPAVINNNYQLWLYGDPLTPNLNINSFWDNRTNVEALHLYYVKSRNAFMCSKHTLASAILGDNKGWEGFVINSANYYDVQINHNTIWNFTYGISVSAATASFGEPLMHGQIYVDSNTINANSTGTIAVPAGEFVGQAIWVTNSLYFSFCPGCWVMGSEVNVDYNTINYAYNGIEVANFLKHTNWVTSNYNTIHLQQDPTVVAHTAPQTGIRHDNNEPGYIAHNTIDGPGYNLPDQTTSLLYGGGGSGASIINPIMEGIHASANTSEFISCNNVTRLNTGFFFGGTNIYHKWVLNSMSNNYYGYALDGLIGNQPDWTLSNVTGNAWDNAFWGGFPPISYPYQTYTVGVTSPLLSPLTVRSSLSETPSHNGHDFTAFPYPAFSSLHIMPPAVPEYPGCIDIPLPSVVHPSLMPVHIVKKNLDFIIDSNVKYWIAQKMVYDAMQADSTMDTVAELHTFRLMADGRSRYAWLNAIENSLAVGDYATANTLLAYNMDSLSNADTDSLSGVQMGDNAGADMVVNNYVQYYQLLLKYMTDTLNSTDSSLISILASKCPYIEGSIVFNARVLYAMVFNDLHPFNDLGCEGKSCDIGSRKAGNTASESTDGQRYYLYPNPNEGKLNIQQTIIDIAPVKAEIVNETGISIYQKDILFNSGNYTINLNNVSTGIYLLKLNDSKGNNFIIKFTIIK